MNSFILLTGATGFLGRFLLRDLLLAGQRVAVLVRSPERLAALLDFWSQQLGRTLPPPVILQGDLHLPSVGLTAADRRWLARHGRGVLHAAASVAFRADAQGEPWRTNVEGTRALLQLARELGLREWHHVSTAFVCGRGRDIVREEELECGQQFHNPYEESKYEAERLLRQIAGLCATIYRPSVIVGDSQTGYTSSYAGLYRFLELSARLAGTVPMGERRPLPLRVPLDGDEACDLVPVDWVSRAIVELMARPEGHGQTFHLVARPPATARLIQQVAAEELGLCGIELVGRSGVAARSRLEELFQEGLAEYWHYLGGTPVFIDRRTAAALPHLPPPRIDEPRLRRLIQFARAQRWGRASLSTSAGTAAGSACTHYFEQTFPRRARQSSLARTVGLNILVGFDIQGPGGGQWSCRWEQGELKYIHRGLEEKPQVVYHTDTATFAAVVEGRQAPQQAFFAERIAITGDLEIALKLAALFEQFLHETTPPSPPRMEALDAARP